MASKRRLRRKQCDRKFRFLDRQAADDHARAQSRKLRSWIIAYHCPHCNGFHVGHTPAKIRRAINARRSGV